MPAIPWEWRNPITKTERTGRMRTRVQSWTRKLILQLELKHTRTCMFDDRSKPPVVAGTEYQWIDATHNDVACYLHIAPKEQS